MSSLKELAMKKDNSKAKKYQPKKIKSEADLKASKKNEGSVLFLDGAYDLKYARKQLELLLSKS